MTTVLAIGDPHFQIGNLVEVDMLISKVVEIIINKNPDIVVILGDLLHTHERLHTSPLNKAYEFVDKCRQLVPTYVLVGNHDMVNNQIYLSSDHWMNGMKEWDNVTIVDQVIRTKEGFMMCPYVFPGRFKEALSTYQGEHWNTARAIFSHQEFAGCKMGAIISIEGDKWDVNDPSIISGHIHDRQTPQKNIYYTGSSMQHAFGESSRKTIAFLTFPVDKTEYHLEEIELHLPKKKILYMDVDKVDTFEVPDTQDHLKVTISGSYDEFKALKKTKKYTDLLQKGVKVVFKPDKLTKKKEKKEIEEEEAPVSNSTKFHSILSEIVMGGKDSYLCQAYELIVNNREVNDDDVLFI